MTKKKGSETEPRDASKAPKSKLEGRARRHRAGRQRNAEQHGRSRALILMGRGIVIAGLPVPSFKEEKFAALVANGTITGGRTMVSVWREWR